MAKKYQFIASVIIVGTLGIQVLAGFDVFNKRCWPFLYYDMYSPGFEEGDAVNLYQLKGILEDGSEIQISKEDLEFNRYQFVYGPVGAIRANEVDEVRKYADIVEAKKNVQLAALTLESFPYVISKQGYVKRDKQVIGTVPLQ